jgi:branched-chain amino acid aminotransferase
VPRIRAGCNTSYFGKAAGQRHADLAPCRAEVAVLIPRSIVALQDPETAQYQIMPGEEARISAFDRSFHFGDSLYEVARSYNGILYAFDEHITRLRRSASLAHFEELPDLDQLGRMVHDACHAFFARYGNVEVYVRTTISRGVGDVNIDRQSSGRPYALVIVKDLRGGGQTPGAPSAPLPPQKWVVARRRRNLVSALDPAMKSGNYLNSVLALAEAQSYGADDALMLDHRGYATEGTTSNFFVAKHGEVWTAPLSVGILAGVTRAQVLETCRDLAIPVRERLMSRYDLQHVDELFLSSSTREVQAIGTLDGRQVGDGGPGPLTARIAVGLRTRIDAWCAEHAANSLWL